MQIPKIIHQVWEGKTTPLPDFLCKLGKSWRDKNPDWEYDVMRWDVIRYMILYKIGGLYVDFDYECLEPIEPILGEWEAAYKSKGSVSFVLVPVSSTGTSTS